MDLPKIKINQKPKYLHVADDVDLFELFKIVEQEYEICFILESLGEASQTSRYLVVGFDPDHIIRANHKTLYFDDQKFKVENPYETLREIVPQDCIARQYSGGLVGYMSYDSIKYIEPTVNVKVHDKFDQFAFGVYTDGLVQDTVTNELFYFYYENNRIDEVKRLLNSNRPPAKVIVEHARDTMTRDEHVKAVNEVKEHIRAGRVFQTEVGFKSEYKIIGDDILIYEKLREVNPSPFMYYVKFGEEKIIGASPELLMSLKDGHIETHPLAGTTKRGLGPSEDARLARELVNDKKEAAEHKMLVDLHRNDIGRVSKFGTVNVRSLMDVRKYPYVQHMCSEISGILADGEDMFTGLASLFPGGVLSGAPKIESIKIIDDLEPDARGPYGGALGYFGFNGDATFAIPIRTLFVSGEYAYTQTCSGIVHDSNPRKEYEEIERKLMGMKNTLASFV